MTRTFTPEEAALLQRYVSNTQAPVFTVQNLPEEVVAVLFAYYSRSKESLRENLLRLLADRDLDVDPSHAGVSSEDRLSQARERARQFHEKWVVGYGHASVAEHGVAHVAIEDVSILASKVIEDNRLASYTEKSTRYVVFDPERYYRAPELDATPFSSAYHQTTKELLQAYADLTPRVTAAVKSALPRREGQTETGYNAACRAKTCDILRYLLPAATFTNIGMTINGRALEHMITKLLSDSLTEAREVGAAVKRETSGVLPTLLKYADYNPYIAETSAAMRRLTSTLVDDSSPGPAPKTPNANQVSLVWFDPRAEDRLIEAILFEHGRIEAGGLAPLVGALDEDQKRSVIDEYLSRRGKWDEPLRALEHIYYTFEIVVDFGAFRDIQRHRMSTQTTQLLTDTLGYETPPEVIEFGLRDRFDELMQRASRTFRLIAAEYPFEAQYVLPLAYRKRALFTWNLRSLHHFISLRSAKQGHSSYRAIARMIFAEIEKVHPSLAGYIRVDLGDYALARI